LVIRRHNEADLRSLAELFTETVWRVNIRDYSLEQIAAWAPQSPDLDWWRKRVAGLSFWIAELDGCLAGFCGLGPDGHLDLLYTDYRFQRRGVARSLYQQVEADARTAGIRRLFTEASITARPFFEAMGFRVLREQHVELRGVTFRNYAMEKSIECPA